MKTTKHGKAAAFALLLWGLVMIQTGWSQTILFDQTSLSVMPGDTFTLQISGNTGGQTLSGFSLYLNVSTVDASPSPFSVTFASLGPLWSYSGGSPGVPQTVPYAPANSQDYGNAFSASTLSSGTYLLTTLTFKVSNSASPSVTPYSLKSTPSSIFLDGTFNEYTPAAAELNITIIPEPSSWVLVGIGLGVLLVFRRASKNNRSLGGAAPAVLAK